MSIIPQARYWLCCGSQDEAHRDRTCMEAKVGHPERCRFGTAAEHSEWQLARRANVCATCSGTGWFHFTGPGGGEGTCPDCHGVGRR